MSTDIRGPVPGDEESPVTVGAGDDGHQASGIKHIRPGVVVRVIAHLAVWAPFLDALIRALRGGWRPVSDAAVIAFRSWDVLTANGLLVGEATRLAHGVYDLGPLEFWLLTLPVHIDPVRGVLWGGTAWCLVAASIAIEAAWAGAGELGAVLASVIILWMVVWIHQMVTQPAWNPWFGTMFFVAALAAGWQVLSGRLKWWPVLAVTGSVAAQAHLMYALASACVLAVGFVTVIVDSRRSREYRWAILGVIAGLGCWAAPLIQQVTAPTGNITKLIQALRAGGTAKAGLSFGLKALSAATQPPAYWWTHSVWTMKLSAVEQRGVWFGAVQIASMALILVLAKVVLRSRRAAALAALSLVTSAAALETYSSIPLQEISRSVTDLSYLMAPMFPVGVLTWLTAGYVLVLATLRATGRLPARGATRQAVGGPTGPVRIATESRALWTARVGAIALIIGLATWVTTPIGGPSQRQSAGRLATTYASVKIEREIPVGRIALAVVAPRDIYRQVLMGLAYSLRTPGYTPEIAPMGAFQLGPAYYRSGNSVRRVTVFAHIHGTLVHVVITRS